MPRQLPLHLLVHPVPVPQPEQTLPEKRSGLTLVPLQELGVELLRKSV